MGLKKLMEKISVKEYSVNEALKTMSKEEYENYYIQKTDAERKKNAAKSMAFAAMPKNVSLDEMLKNVSNKELVKRINTANESTVKDSLIGNVGRVIEDTLNISDENRMYSNAETTLEDYEKRYPEFFNTHDVSKIVEEESKKIEFNSIRQYLDSYPELYDEFLDNYIDENKISEIEENINNIETFTEKKIKVDHPYQDKLNELKQGVTDQNTLDSLDYINNSILTSISIDELKSISLFAEDVLGFQSKKQNLEVAQELEKNEQYKKAVSIGEDGQASANISDKGKDTKEFKQSVLNEQFVFSDDTKKIIKDALTMIQDMKDIDGNSMFKLNEYKLEESSKAYGLKNLDTLRADALKVLNSDDPEKLNKLNKIASFHKEALDKYKEFFKLVEKLDMPSIPANISVSRNGAMPEDIIKDFKNVSKLNGLWHVYAKIQKANCTIDDYLNNPMDVYLKSSKAYQNFNKINDIANQMGDLDFIQAVASKDSKILSSLQKEVREGTDGQRFFLTTGMIDKDNSAHNRMITDLMNYTITNQTSMSYVNAFNNYLGENKIDTIKNILLNTNDVKDYMSLSQSNKLPNCNITGESVNKSDYQTNLNNTKGNIDKLIDKLAMINSQLDRPEYKNIKADMSKAISELSVDLLKTKNFDNTKYFTKLVETSGKSISDIYNSRKGNVHFNEHMRNEYNALKAKDKLEGEDLIQGLNQIKAVSDKYAKRNFFTKYLSPYGRAENKLLNEMKQDMIAKGVNPETLDNYLKGNIKQDEALEQLKDAVPEREQIEVIEAGEMDQPEKQQEALAKEQQLDLETDLENELNGQEL